MKHAGTPRPCRVLFTALVVVLFSAMICSCGKPQPPRYVGVDALEMGAVGLDESRLSVQVSFWNPNGFSLQLMDAESDVWIDGKPLGKSKLEQPLEVPRKDTFAVPVVIKVSTLNLLGGALAFLQDKEKKREVEIKGWADIRKSGIRKRIPIDYKGLHSLDELEKNGKPLPPVTQNLK